MKLVLMACSFEKQRQIQDVISIVDLSGFSATRMNKKVY